MATTHPGEQLYEAYQACPPVNTWTREGPDGEVQSGQCCAWVELDGSRKQAWDSLWSLNPKSCTDGEVYFTYHMKQLNHVNFEGAPVPDLTWDKLQEHQRNKWNAVHQEALALLG